MIEILARHLYLAVAQATRDHWVEWEHLAFVERSGYYDLAYEIADEIHAAQQDGAA